MTDLLSAGNSYVLNDYRGTTQHSPFEPKVSAGQNEVSKMCVLHTCVCSCACACVWSLKSWSDLPRPVVHRDLSGTTLKPKGEESRTAHDWSLP